MHLAGMELKEKWKSLEPQIQELETKAKAGGEKAGDVITAQVSALAAGLKQFAEELGNAVSPGKKKAEAEAAPDTEKVPEPPKAD